MARKLPVTPVGSGSAPLPPGRPTPPAGGAAPGPDGGKSGSPGGFLLLWFGLPLLLVLAAQYFDLGRRVSEWVSGLFGR